MPQAAVGELLQKDALGPLCSRKRRRQPDMRDPCRRSPARAAPWSIFPELPIRSPATPMRRWQWCGRRRIYVFRTLLAGDIPLNEGLPAPDPAAGAGRLPAQSAAAGLRSRPATSRPPRRWSTPCSGPPAPPAASQGTMNNLTFGNERFQYYETVAGGARRHC